MRVIVIGAGEVGSYVAERLSQEGHDVALVDLDPTRVREFEDRLDALVVLGSGTDPDTLTAVGANRADLVVAVTSDDEVNVVSAMLASQLGATRSIVRIENPGLRAAVTGPLRDRSGADVVIDPDEETSAEIIELVNNPGVIEVQSMADGEILVQGVRLPPDAPVVGHTLEELGVAYAPNWRFLFAAITRANETFIPRGNHRFEPEDLVRVVCTPDARQELAGLLGLNRNIPRRVVLLGGGRTAEILAGRLRDHVRHVVVAEQDPERATELATRLEHTEVMCGDITDLEFLAAIDIGPDDLVVALTGDDDANILACLHAKSAGVQETISVAHRLSVLPLLAEVGIDGALSPRTATANAVLRFARGGATAVATFLTGDIEVLELPIHPDSPAAGQTLAELHLPKDALVGAVLTDGGAQIGRGSTQLHPGDRVVLLGRTATIPAARRAFG